MPTTRTRPVQLALLAILASPFSSLSVAALRAQVLAGKPVPSAAPLGTAGAQLKFESSLTGGAIAQPYKNAPLSWSAYPGASSYHVLRYASASSAPVSVAAVTQTQYTARVLPGYSFVFRVVAYGVGKQVLDSTKTVSLTIPAAAAPTQLSATCTVNAGAVNLAWNAIVNADDYWVFLYIPGSRGVHGRLPADTLVNSNIVATSFAFHPSTTAQTESDYSIRIQASYALPDYPTAGQTTRVAASSTTYDHVNAYHAPGAC